MTIKSVLVDYVVPVALGSIPMVFAFTALFAWMSCDSNVLRECMKHRPLAECQADVANLP